MDKEGLYYAATAVLVIVGLVSVSVVVLTYILKLLKGEENTNEEDRKNEQLSEPSDKKQKEVVQRKTKKKTRIIKQDFKHVLLYSTLKCVKGEVCDIDYSSNGKFLATCSTEKGEASSSTNSSESSTPQSSATSTPTMKTTLTRRQRKNRKEKDIVPNAQMNTYEQDDMPGLQWSKMGGSESSLASALLNFCLSSADRFANGYPIEIVDSPGQAMVYCPPRPKMQKGATGHFDVNAREFVPKNQRDSAYNSSESCSSSTSSGNSSDSDECMDRDDQKRIVITTHPSFAIPIMCETYPRSVPFEMMNFSIRSFNKNVPFYHRDCMRCNQKFVVDKDNTIVNKEKCIYHPGKRIFKVVNGSEIKINEVKASHLWNCCDKPSGAKGCCVFKQHVWSGATEGFNAPLSSYVKTKHVRVPNKKNSYGVYALDCEMSFTKNGLELTKVTVINMYGKVVYDTYVLPENPIVDYNTRFSGVTSKHLSGKSVKSLKEVQNDLMGFINADTIIVGHALENDFRALKIIHEKIVDTAFLYPHNKGYPFKQSLKTLSDRHLSLEIQKGTNGHNPREDAWAAMQLAVHRAMTDLPLDYYRY